MSSCFFPEHHKARGYGALIAVAAVVAVAVRFRRLAESIGLIGAWSAAGVLVACLAVAVVRFARLPAAAKRHYPAAVWARWRWRWMVRALGLAYTDQHRKAVKPVPFGTSVKVAKTAGDTAVLRFPRARIRADEHGVVAIVRTVPGTGRQEFEDAAEHIANQWRCVRVSVSQTAPGRLIVRGLRRDPLMTPFGLETAPDGLSVRHLWLGKDEHGVDRFADLSNCPGITVGGMPGAGKSTELTLWLAQLAPSDAVQFVTLDGKGTSEFLDFEDRAWLTGDDDLDGALRILKAVHALMIARLTSVRGVLGVKNAWHVGPTADWPLVVLVIDECQSFLDISAVKGDKDREPAVRRCIALVSSLVRKGRSAMMLTIVATQKPSSDSLPSSIQANCPLSLAFGLKTIEAAVATLGSSIRDYPSYSPVSLADPVYAGCATVTLRTGSDPYTRLRGPWISEGQAAEVAAASVHLRRDPQASLPVSVPDDASELVSEGR